MDPEQTSLSSDRLLGPVFRRAPWIIVSVLLVAAAAYVYSKHQVKEYTATATVGFETNPLSQQIAGLSPNSSSSSLTQQNSDLELVKVGSTAAKTARLLGHGLTYEKVSESVSISGKTETSVVDISAVSTSPALAAAIANTYAQQFVKEQQSATSRFFKSALKVVRKQLAALSPAQRFGSDGLDLQERAHTLGLLAELGYNNAQVAGEASVPSVASSPRTKRNAILGALVGLLVSLAVVFLLERRDRRVRGLEELEAIYQLPLLGAVPKSSARAGSPLPPTEAEAFSLIRAHLRFFNVDREVRTVVIASPTPGDGKTTIALHLAEAAARSGSRVLLLEVDLRRPSLVKRLAIQAGPGLADVLIGAVSMSQATQTVALEAPSSQGIGGHTLDVVAAGAVLPPNPGELLESQAMDALLGQAKSSYDLVVIDTPPLAAVSDAFPLLTKVDGVVIVGRIGYSRRDSAEQLHQILASSGAPLLGVIANESKSGGPVPYLGGGGSSAGVRSGDGAAGAEKLSPTASA
jgi:succinoglycan biosynthesis transport protein ExoP